MPEALTASHHVTGDRWTAPSVKNKAGKGEALVS